MQTLQILASKVYWSLFSTIIKKLQSINFLNRTAPQNSTRALFFFFSLINKYITEMKKKKCISEIFAHAFWLKCKCIFYMIPIETADLSLYINIVSIFFFTCKCLTCVSRLNKIHCFAILYMLLTIIYSSLHLFKQEYSLRN